MNRIFTSKSGKCAAALGAVALSLLPSCQDEDFGYTAEQIKYAKNFTDVYGKIPVNKNWDLSASSNWHDFVSSDQGTRAGESPELKDLQFSVADNWYYVDNGLLNWMTDQLKEGNDNRYLGTNFVLRVPESDFAIIPIFQGGSSIMSELELKVNGYKLQKIWTKSDNVEVKDGSDNWEKAGYFEGNRTWSSIEKSSTKATWTKEDNDHWISTRKSPANEDVYGCNHGYFHPWKLFIGAEYDVPYYPLHSASTIGVDAVRSKPLVFKKDQIQPTSGAEFMYLGLRNIAKNPQLQNDQGYWDPEDENAPNRHWVTVIHQQDADGNFITKPWDEGDAWTNIGDRLTSINTGGYMLALNVPTEYRPDPAKLRSILGINDESVIPQCIVVGCEDANGAASDHDNNDVVFLVVGNPAPQIVPTTEVVKKRYMCEDLGATDDFDFNDVVVDVTQTREIEIETTPIGLSDSFFNTGDEITSESSVEIAPINSTSVKSTTQTAKIMHVCGTLPLQVRVGNYFFPKIIDPTDQFDTRKRLEADGYLLSSGNAFTRAKNEVVQGWNPNEEKIIPDNSWNPETNNIKVYVDWTGVGNVSDHESDDYSNTTPTNPSEEDKMFADFANGNFRVVNFPKPGKVPYIIAVDQDVPWMNERKSIPEDWVNGNFSRRDYTDQDGLMIQGPGSVTYYENYGSDKSEAVLWKGSIKGAQNITILDLSAENYKKGIDEAADKFFNIIEIYTAGDVHVTGNTYEHGKFSLCYKNGSEWTSLFDGSTYPDYLMQDEHTPDGGHVTYVMLTDSQLSLIRNKGLGIISRTNGLEITKVTMYRLWDPVENIPAQDYTATAGKYQTGCELIIKKTTNGSVSVNDRTSLKDGFGKSGDYRVLYPYSVNVSGWDTDYHGSNGTLHDQHNYQMKVTLTAKADPGYVFDKWQDNNSTEKVRDVVIQKNGLLEYQALFTTGTPTNFKFANSNQKELEYSLYVGERTTVNFSSDNAGTPYEIGSYDNRVIGVHYDNSTYHNSLVIDPIAVSAGSVDFTIQQPEGHYNSTAYSTSDKLKVKVAVKKVPANIPLTTSMFHEWNEISPDMYIVGNDGITSNVNSGTIANSNQYATTVLGSTWNNSNGKKIFSDLNSSDYIVINTEKGAGVPILWFNTGGDDNLHFSANNSDYCSVLTNSDESYSYVVDVTKVRNAKGYSLLSAITTPEGQGASTSITSVYVDKYECPAESYKMLNLTCDDEDYDLFINDKQTTSTHVSVGAKVKVKAVKKSSVTRDANVYRFKWTGVSVDKLRTEDNEEATFTMPEAEVTKVTVTALYAVAPLRFLHIGDEYKPSYNLAFNVGNVSVSGDGQELTNQTIYVPLNATITAKASAEFGYEFEEWRYQNNTDPDNHSFNQNGKKEINYYPQAIFKEQASTQVYYKEGGLMINTEYHTYDINEDFCSDFFKILSPTKKTIVIVFTDVCSEGVINLRTSWDQGGGVAAGQNLSIANYPWVKVTLTEDEYNTVQNNKKLILQHANFTSTNEIKIKQIIIEQ